MSNIFSDEDLTEFKRLNEPGGAVWFMDLVAEVRDGHGYRPRVDHLADDLAEQWADFAALPRPARLRWARAVKIEIDNGSAQNDVRDIAEAIESDDHDIGRVLLDAFRLNVANLKELTDEERREWIKRGQSAVRGKLSTDDADNLGYVRARLVCSAQAEVVVGIYFVTTDGYAVKIGFASNVAARLRTLQTASHRPLHLLVVIAGTQAEERELHRRFAADRLQGEWFRLSDDLKAFISAEKAKQAAK